MWLHLLNLKDSTDRAKVSQASNLSLIRPYLSVVAECSSMKENEMSGLIGLLVGLLVFCIVVAVFSYFLSLIPMPAPWGNIVRIILGLIALLFLIGFLMRAFGGGRYNFGF
jgi:F0F1-type ATP synthase assembly protein I